MDDLPDYVQLCPYCEGTGETPQTYTLGCGLGYATMSGPCPMCGKHSRFMRPGPGYIYKATCEPVPTSVLAQIENAMTSKEMRK